MTHIRLAALGAVVFGAACASGGPSAPARRGPAPAPLASIVAPSPDPRVGLDPGMHDAEQSFGAARRECEAFILLGLVRMMRLLNGLDQFEDLDRGAARQTPLGIADLETRQ